MSDTVAGSAVHAPRRVLDLFAGAGGMTQGFHDTGRFRSVGAVELDPEAAATFAANFPGVPIAAMTVHEWLERGELPAADVVVGGPPCQGFSTLGKQDAEDIRNVLWRDYVRTIDKVRPKYFVLENVSAFRRSPQFTALTEAMERGGVLEDYDWECDVLNAADFGAPQARRRTILIGRQRDLAAPGMPAPTHVGRHITVRQAFRYVRRETTDIDLPERWTTSHTGTFRGRFRGNELHLSRHYASTSLARIRSIPPGGNRFDIRPELLPPCWRNYTTGGADVMGRLRWDKPSVTIRTEFWKPEKGRYLHPEADRAITHHEAALLQGFDPKRLWVGSKASIGRQIGNAVPVALSDSIARHLADASW